MDVQIRSNDLRDMARDFRAAGRRDLAKEMLKEMRDEVKPIVPAIRSAIRSTPSSTGAERSRSARQKRPRGLRDAEARGVQVKASLTGPKAGVRLRIDPRLFPPEEKNLVRYREGVLSTHRSPNWGRRDWKSQQPKPTFFRTIQPHIPRVQAAVIRIATDYQNRLTSQGPAT